MADKKSVRLTHNEITLILSRLTGDTPLTRKLKQAIKTKGSK